MADQPQDLNSSTPPVQPTEAFKPLNYTPVGQQATPAQQPLNAYTPQAPYVAPAGQYTPSYPAPERKKRGGALVWVLGSCGVIAVLGFIVVAVMVKGVMNQVGKSDLAQNASSLPTARQNLTEIRAGLDKYKQAHNGKYPASLGDAVDASYLTYASSNRSVKVEYTAPGANTPDDATVARFYVGQISMNIGQAIDQRLYLVLLKNGTTAREQVVRTADRNN